MKNVHSICYFLLLPGLLAWITFDPIFQEETVEMERGRPTFEIYGVPFTTTVDRPASKW